MILEIQLTPEEEARLKAVAQRKGIEPVECIRQLLDEYLLTSAGNESDTADLRKHFYFTATEEEFEKALSRYYSHRPAQYLSSLAGCGIIRQMRRVA